MLKMLRDTRSPDEIKNKGDKAEFKSDAKNAGVSDEKQKDFDRMEEYLRGN